MIGSYLFQKKVFYLGAPAIAPVAKHLQCVLL